MRGFLILTIAALTGIILGAEPTNYVPTNALTVTHVTNWLTLVEPRIVRTEWKRETNRVDHSRTSPIRSAESARLTLYIANTIHFTELVSSNLYAVVVYGGREFPVRLESVHISSTEKTRTENNPFSTNADR